MGEIPKIVSGNNIIAVDDARHAIHSQCKGCRYLLTGSIHDAAKIVRGEGGLLL